MSKFHKIFLGLFLIISFLIRINRLDFPLSALFAWGDGTRDYLIASHIVKYGEFPFVGPYNLLYESGIKGSPVYFYILSLPLLIYNHPLTLGFVNIILQVLVLVLIFLTVRSIFNIRVALIAVVLFGFNPEVIKMSDYIWQPYLMLPVALLSFYFFIQRRLLLSTISISLAFALHSSAFPWLVIFLIWGFSRKTLLVFFLTLTLLYSPVILSFSDISNLPAQTVEGYLKNLLNHLTAFSNTFNVGMIFLIGLLMITTLLIYRRKPSLGLIMALFLSPILFASFFNKIRLHYLILSIPSFVILVAYLVDLINLRMLRFMLAFILTAIFSQNLIFLNQLKTPLGNQHLIDQVADQVILELDQIKKDNGFAKLNFFQVKSYTSFDYPILDTILLTALEQKLNLRLSRISDDSPYNHVQINQDVYIILNCFKIPPTVEFDCPQAFVKSNQDFKLLKNIYLGEGLSVYLLKRG